MAEKRLLVAPSLCAMGLFSLATSRSLKTGLAVSDGKSWISLPGELLSFGERCHSAAVKGDLGDVQHGAGGQEETC